MKSVVSLAVFAPFHLINEVSLRIMFLPQQLISKVLLTAILFDVAITVAIGILRLLSGSFSLLYGELPFIALVLSCLVLILLYLLFHTVSLTLYDELKHMFPRDVAGASRSAKMMQVDSGEDLGSVVASAFAGAASNSVSTDNRSVGIDNTQGLHKLQPETVTNSESSTQPAASQPQENPPMTDLDLLAEQLQSLAGQTLGVGQQAQPGTKKLAQRAADLFSSNVVNSEPLRNYKMNMQNKVQALKKHPFRPEEFTDEDLQKLNTAMDSAADSMKFINEQFINEFINNQIDEDTAFIDGLDISVIPSTFTMLA